jgi:hypothetical protein
MSHAPRLVTDLIGRRRLMGRSRVSLPRAAAVLLLASIAASCDKAPLTAPTDSAITLFAHSTVVALHGSTEVTANVTEPGGVPVQNGTQVTFTSTLGRLEPAEARTSGGRATVRLLAGAASGVAQIRAFTGGAQAEALEIQVGAAAVSTVTLTPIPAVVGPNGGEVEILAVVTGEGNRRLPGVSVTFGTTAGTLRDVTVVTDIAGEARTRLTTTREATVSATVGSVQQSAVVGVTARPSVTISGPSTAVGVGETTTFTVSVQPQQNGEAVRDVTIDFGDGTRQSLGPLTGSRAVQTAFARAGSFTVTVTVTSADGDATTHATAVTVEDRAIGVTLAANPIAPAVGANVTFTATTTGTNIVSYVWDFGDGTTRVSTGPSTNHVYGSAGRKIVRLDVTNAAGQQGSQTIEVLVQ